MAIFLCTVISLQNIFNMKQRFITTFNLNDSQFLKLHYFSVQSGLSKTFSLVQNVIICILLNMKFITTKVK